MSKHTPGPWESKNLINGNYGDDGFVVLWPDISKGGVHMRRIDRFNGTFSRADANLIAAAPELLEALISLLAEEEQSEVYIDSICGSLRTLEELESDDDLPSVIYKARAAIAKAKGETP